MPLTTLYSLVRREAELLSTADKRIGWPVDMAHDATALLSTFIASVSASRQVFMRCMAILKTHHTLAFMSILRSHHVQAMMNLRQTAEAATIAAYALAHPNAEFADSNSGLIMCPKKISKRANRWIQSYFPQHSDDIKLTKDLINESAAHFNIINSEFLFRNDPENCISHTDYFDKEDRYISHIDIWLFTKLALCSIDLMIQVEQSHGGFQLAADVPMRAHKIQWHADKLRAEIIGSERHQRAAQLIEKTKP